MQLIECITTTAEPVIAALSHPQKAATGCLPTQVVVLEEGLASLEKTKKHLDNEEFVELMQKMEKVGWTNEFVVWLCVLGSLQPGLAPPML